MSGLPHGQLYEKLGWNRIIAAQLAFWNFSLYGPIPLKKCELWNIVASSQNFIYQVIWQFNKRTSFTDG